MTPEQIKRKHQDRLSNVIVLKRELNWSRCRCLEPPETEEEKKELAEANLRFEKADEIEELAGFGCPDTKTIEFIDQSYDGYQFNYRAMVTQKTWDWMQNEGLGHRLVEC
jgi:hypothetical protein